MEAPAAVRCTARHTLVAADDKGERRCGRCRRSDLQVNAGETLVVQTAGGAVRCIGAARRSGRERDARTACERAVMQPTILPGVATWSRWQADRAMSSMRGLSRAKAATWWSIARTDAEDLAFIDERAWTRRDHHRDQNGPPRCSRRYNVRSLPRCDASEMTNGNAHRRPRETLFGWRVIGLTASNPRVRALIARAAAQLRATRSGAYRPAPCA